MKRGFRNPERKSFEHTLIFLFSIAGASGDNVTNIVAIVLHSDSDSGRYSVQIKLTLLIGRGTRCLGLYVRQPHGQSVGSQSVTRGLRGY